MIDFENDIEQCLQVLKNGGLLRSRRGVGGGYQINLQPSQITLRDVVYAIDGPFDPIACTRAMSQRRSSCECGIPGGCPLGRTFSALQKTVHEWLGSTTVADVIANDPPLPAVSFDI